MSFRVAIIGRSELLFDTAVLLHKIGFEIPLIITSKEAPEYKVSSESFREMAKDYNAVFIQTAKINQPEVIEQIKKLGKIDLAVSINYAGIIAQEVIDLFSIGILNAHGGDLPRYRGNACQAWAIINGESQVGLCIHKMVGGELDSGDIITRAFSPLTLDTRISEVWNWMNREIPVLMLEAVEKLTIKNDYVLDTQSKRPEDALRCYPRRPEDGKINWEMRNADIIRLINASSEPYSGAFTTMEETRVVIWRAVLEEDNHENYLAIPGQIASLNKDGSITVICRTGKIRVTEMECDNKRLENPASIIKSIRWRFK